MSGPPLDPSSLPPLRRKFVPGAANEKEEGGNDGRPNFSPGKVSCNFQEILFASYKIELRPVSKLFGSFELCKKTLGKQRYLFYETIPLTPLSLFLFISPLLFPLAKEAASAAPLDIASPLFIAETDKDLTNAKRKIFVYILLFCTYPQNGVLFYVKNNTCRCEECFAALRLPNRP